MPLFGTLGNKTTPLYGGGQVRNPADVLVLNAAPSSNAIGNRVGTVAINQVAGTAYMAVKNTGINGTVTWAVLGGAAADVNTLSGDTGGNIAPVAGNISLAGGTGIATAGAAGVITFSVVGGGLETTVDAVGPTASPAVNTRFVPNTAGLLTINLPAVAAVGDMLQVSGLGAGGWVLDAAAGDTINASGGSTSSGGTLASTNRYDAVTVVCVVANTTWVVESQSGVLNVT